jgi:hypothetical protein
MFVLGIESSRIKIAKIAPGSTVVDIIIYADNSTSNSAIAKTHTANSDEPAYANGTIILNPPPVSLLCQQFSYSSSFATSPSQLFST